MTRDGNGRRRPTVVVVGAGFGGLATVQALRKAPVRTVLLDRNNYQLFAPLLYQVATALIDESDIAHPVRSLVRKVGNAEFRRGTVEAIDVDGRVVRTDQGSVAYDYLVVACGSETNFFGNASVEEHAVGMKELPDALALRHQVLTRFEQAKWTTDGDERRRLLTFVVVGGGSTGIETAGALAELVHHVLRRDYRTIPFEEVSVMLLEASDRLLAPYRPNLQSAARLRLEHMGVEVRLGAAVESVSGEKITLADGSVIPGGLVVWTAGVKGAAAGSLLTAELGPQGRVPVLPTLQVPGHRDVFAVGDMAALDLGTGPLPMLAPVAVQQGRLAARNIVHLIDGRLPETFRYRDKGMMSTIGRNAAVVQTKRLRLSGRVGWLTWMVLHLALITSRRSQVSILWNWIWNYVHHDRPARLIVAPPARNNGVGTASGSNGTARRPAPRQASPAASSAIATRRPT